MTSYLERIVGSVIICSSLHNYYLSAPHIFKSEESLIPIEESISARLVAGCSLLSYVGGMVLTYRTRKNLFNE